jgi:hypothetical protein
MLIRHTSHYPFSASWPLVACPHGSHGISQAQLWLVIGATCGSPDGARGSPRSEVGAMATGKTTEIKVSSVTATALTAYDMT